MSRCQTIVLSFMALASVVPVGCGPPGPGGFAEPAVPDGGSRDPGAVCSHHGDCRSGHCHRLFVCEADRAVSCNRDDNDCPANGLPGSACVEEPTGICIGG